MGKLLGNGIKFGKVPASPTRERPIIIFQITRESIFLAARGHKKLNFPGNKINENSPKHNKIRKIPRKHFNKIN